MNSLHILFFELAIINLTSCTPALHLHEGDQFVMPYAGSSMPSMTLLTALSSGQKTVVQRCGDTSRDYGDMQQIKPLFDRLIFDAETKSNAVLLKDVVITVKKSKCMELQAIPLNKL